MTINVSAVIGSGTTPQTYVILPSSQRGINNNAQGIRTGLQVMVANPEDLNSVEAFAASGVSVGASPLEIIGPHINPLPRCREVIFENTGSADVYLSHNSNVEIADSFELSPEGTAGRSSRVSLPLLHNVSVFARTASGSSVVRMLII